MTLELTDKPKIEWKSRFPSQLITDFDAYHIKCVFDHKKKVIKLYYDGPNGPYEVAPGDDAFKLQLAICGDTDGIFTKSQLVRDSNYVKFRDRLPDFIEEARMKGDLKSKEMYDKKMLYDSVSKLAQKMFRG